MERPQPPRPGRITDVHVHVQPWRELKPAALAVMWRGPDVDRDRMIRIMEDPKALLEEMDRAGVWRVGLVNRSEEHTSELQSHSFISYAVFCLKKKKTIHRRQQLHPPNRGLQRVRAVRRG